MIEFQHMYKRLFTLLSSPAHAKDKQYKRCRCSTLPGDFGYSDTKISHIEKILRMTAAALRLQILLILNKSPHCVTDLMLHTKKPQSLISHHLADLIHLNFVTNLKNGRFVEYSLTKDGRNFVETLKKI